MKKGGFLRNVLDTIRSNQANQNSQQSASQQHGKASDYGNLLKTNHFSLAQVARHGFPLNPTAIAYDPVQKLAVIGTKSGSLRIFGRPGVDVWAQHQPEYAVTHIKFVVNQGAIITVTADESIHLWSLRGPNLKLQFSASSNSPISAISPCQSSSSQANSPTVLGINQNTITSDINTQIGDPNFLQDLTTPTSLAATPSSHLGDQQNLQLKQPEVLHTLKFQREHITCLHLTLSDKWLYIGTERGNVHVVNVETFQLSGYSIAWNKAIELSRKSHPGSIIHISECPQDTNKILIGYESGCIVLWDLKGKNAEGRYYHSDNLLWLAWHYEGKQFMAAHGDGSLITWQTRSNARPVNIVHPHAKAPSSSSSTSMTTSHDPIHSLTTSFARSLNNELYRPINKVEWKTTKNHDQLLILSGGLPHDGLTSLSINQDSNAPSPRLTTPISGIGQQKNIPISPCHLTTAPTPTSSHQSPVSPSRSPLIGDSTTNRSASACSRQSNYLPALNKHLKNLRSTSLTVMQGKSITVLEMDDTIIDFITICDNSPYENDTVDAQASIVLLANDLILIDLTSPGYPSFDSPYSSSQLTESPVTCIQYLADCNSDLIPFLYSSSQNVVSCGPKKGFSEKEWPINGGEWGQSMQSYPELVITGHKDGSIKFWDMSGVNFDLISKIKTSKLFDKPDELPESVIVPYNTVINNTSRQSVPNPSSSTRPIISEQQKVIDPVEVQQQALLQNQVDNNYLAIEKIEYYPTTKHLVVAGAMSQVIQYRLSKKDSNSSADLSTVLIESLPQRSAIIETIKNNQAVQQHFLLKTKGPSQISAPPNVQKPARRFETGRFGGFQAELICLTSMLVSPIQEMITCGDAPASSTSTHGKISLCCQAPSKVTAIVLNESHNILAYAHKHGVVLIDITQKCLIVNASLADLYGCGVGSPNVMTNNRDINPVQSLATSNILQHHYGGSVQTHPTAAFGSNDLPRGANANQVSGYSFSMCQQPSQSSDNAKPTNKMEPGNGYIDASQSTPLSKSCVTGIHASGLKQGQVNQGSDQKSFAGAETESHTTLGRSAPSSRLFQRQATASHLGFGSSTSTGGTEHPSSSGLGLLKRNSAKGSSNTNLSCTTNQVDMNPSPAKSVQKTTKQKRMISRMLSISAIHTTFSDSNKQTNNNNNSTSQDDHHSNHHARNQFDMVTNKTSSGNSNNNTSSLNDTLNNGACGLIKPDPGTSLSSSSAIAAFNASSSNNNNNNTSSSSKVAAANYEQMHPDKFDSAFARSRSSSSSSYVQPTEAAAAAIASVSATNLSNGLESIQCLCFLDPSSAAPASVVSAAVVDNSNNNNSNSNHHHHNNQATISSSMDANKSFGSIEQNNGQFLALWLGTSVGSVLLVGLTMPDSEDNRVLQLQSVLAEPMPQATIKLEGAILHLAAFQLEPSRSWSPISNSQTGPLNSTGSQTSAGSLESEPPSSTSTASGSGCSGGATVRAGAEMQAHESRSPAQFMILVSEKQTRVYQVPASLIPSSLRNSHGSSSNSSAAPGTGSTAPPSSTTTSISSPASQQHSSLLSSSHHSSSDHSSAISFSNQLEKFLTNKYNCLVKCQLSDTSFVRKSQLVYWRQPFEGECCLVSYLATGNIVIHSLPHLRLLMEADFVPETSPLIASSMLFSRNGHCLYQPSPSEICKFTISSQYKSMIQEMIGTLYTNREMPEMPRPNFFKSLFSVASSAVNKQTERDELFGESGAGKPPRAVAKHISNFDKLKGAQGGLASELLQAREGLNERGEKLSEIEDRTLSMMNQAEGYSQAAHQLAQKYKDKKWYQF